jgi:predicted membrane-bound mannosyltransferase/DNA-binding beta-propeller fold protein YncE
MAGGGIEFRYAIQLVEISAFLPAFGEQSMTDNPTVAPEAPTKPWLNLDLEIGRIFPWNLENFLAVVILVLAIVTRLYGLGDRGISHDEVNHFVPSYDLAQGLGFRFDPMTHGPLQMHLIALSFITFGDNDFTARLPAALFSIATVGIALFLFRRYLGRVGALAAGLFFLISPYMLYYGRYQRNEAFIVVWSLLSIYAVLRYLERGETGVLILFTVVTALHYTDKATGWIYAGGLMVFLAGYFLYRLFRRKDVNGLTMLRFLACMAVAAVFFVAAVFLLRNAESLTMIPGLVVVVIGLVVGIIGIVLLFQDLGEVIRRERSFDLMVLLVTFTIPLSSAALMDTLGKTLGTRAPQDMNFSLINGISDLLQTKDLYTALAYVAPLFLIAILIGLWWNRKLWPVLALIFLGIYAVFFTSVFTNAGGLFDGLVRFLGYWIKQNEEARGGQPWFYYLFLQIPIYEYLPAIGAVIALVIAIRRKLWAAESNHPYTAFAGGEEETRIAIPTITLFLFWALFNLAIFSYAGEKMPQQTMLISAPMILAAAWVVGYLVQTESSRSLRTVRGFLLAALAVLAVLTARTAYTATYINYDYPFEYMAYAHGGTGPKIVLKEIERLSYLTTGTTNLVVAYDNYVRYPFWWSLRHYPNKIDFDVNPTEDIRRAAIVVVGEQNNDKVTPILGQDYVGFRLVRMWWHNEDYFNLKWDFIKSEYLGEEAAKDAKSPPPMSALDYLRLAWGHVGPLLVDPRVRGAAFQIWLNRDYTQWNQVMGHGGYTLDDWSLSEGMYVYFRKDILDYLGGSTQVQAAAASTAVDPYELSRIDLVPDNAFGQKGTDPGQLSVPRGVAVAADGSLYVADSINNRIEHFDAKGSLIKAWGTFADVQQGDAPGGTFNEPWGIAVAPDGSVYVADTWNHRVQKFSADGAFLAMWGAKPGTATDALSFYGPRSVAVDSQGRVFIADTGNKRIVILSSDGTLLGQFGSPGAGDGQLDEPVGLAVDAESRVYVADTWNHRVQIFAPNPDGSYTPAGSFDISGWFGTSPDTKPYLAVDSSHHIYITDPGSCRIIEFNERGVVLSVWGKCGDDPNSLDTPTGIAIDPLGGLWVSDSRHDRLVHFTQPDRVQDLLQAP